MFGVLDDDTVAGLDAHLPGGVLVDRRLGLAGPVDVLGADDLVEPLQVEPVGDGFNPVGWRRGDDRRSDAVLVEVGEQVAKPGHEFGVLGVDLAGDLLEPVDVLRTIDEGRVVRIEVLVDLLIVHAGDLAHGDVLLDDRRQ